MLIGNLVVSILFIRALLVWSNAFHAAAWHVMVSRAAPQGVQLARRSSARCPATSLRRLGALAAASIILKLRPSNCRTKLVNQRGGVRPAAAVLVPLLRCWTYRADAVLIAQLTVIVLAVWRLVVLQGAQDVQLACLCQAGLRAGAQVSAAALAEPFTSVCFMKRWLRQHPSMSSPSGGSLSSREPRISSLPAVVWLACVQEHRCQRLYDPSLLYICGQRGSSSNSGWPTCKQADGVLPLPHSHHATALVQLVTRAEMIRERVPQALGFRCQAVPGRNMP